MPQTPAARTLAPIVGGAAIHATPLTTLPNAVAPIAATNVPTATYLAQRTTRQKMNCVTYRSVRSRARVRSRAGRGLLGELGCMKYEKLRFAFLRAELLCWVTAASSLLMLVWVWVCLVWVVVVGVVVDVVADGDGGVAKADASKGAPLDGDMFDSDELI